MLDIAAQARQFERWRKLLIPTDRMEAMVQLLTHVSKMLLFLLFIFISGCVAAGPPIAQGYNQIVYVNTIKIPQLHLNFREDSRVKLVGMVSETEYGSLAIFPEGKIKGTDDSGKCIDLVYSDSFKNMLNSLKHRDVTIYGKLIYIDSIPSFTASLSFDGIFHKPVCQIFSEIKRYPYFVVEGLDKRTLSKVHHPLRKN